MANEQNNDDRLKKIFVGGLSRSTTNDGLRAYFESYGEMSDCVVIVDPQSKESRGFGYVTFVDKNSVIEVLKYKKEKGAHTIDEKEVEVKRAIPRDDDSATARLKTKKIFIGGLKDEATADDIHQALAESVRGIPPNSVDLIMKKNEDGTSKHRGFCFVEFEDEDIVDELCCIKKVNISGKVVEIKKAEPKDKDKGGPSGRGGRGGGGRGSFGAGRGRGGGGDYGGGGYGYQGSYNESYGYQGGDYGGYNYGAYGGGAYDAYGGMGMGAYQQAPSSYGPQGGYGQGGGGGRGGGGRYRPY